MSMDEVSRTPEYNVLWDDSQLEFEDWVERSEAEARIGEILAEEAENDYYDEAELAELVVLVRRWRIVYVDDDWDYLRDAVAEEASDDARAEADEVRLALGE